VLLGQCKKNNLLKYVYIKNNNNSNGDGDGDDDSSNYNGYKKHSNKGASVAKWLAYLPLRSQESH
jgi:hypothetical protein